MSVIESKRKEATTEFLKNARDIEEIFIDLRINKPKRYSFFFDKLLDYSFNLLSSVKAGNSIYPENEIEMKMRQKYFKEGLAYCQVLNSQIEVVASKLKEDGISIKLIQTLAEKIIYEIKLLKGVISADKKKYAFLLEQK